MFDPPEGAHGASQLLGGLDMVSLAGIENIIETLEEPFEDMERRILISSMVQDAVCRGFLKAMEEDLAAQLSAKDAVIRHLEARMVEKEEEISNLHKTLEATGSGKHSSFSHSPSISVESLHKVLQEREDEIAKKSMELELVVSRLEQISSALNDERERASLLENQVISLKEQEREQSQIISSLLHSESRKKPSFERQFTMQDMDQVMKTASVHSELGNVVVSETVVTDVKELEWKADVEAMVMKHLIERWYQQVIELLQNLQSGLAQKDQRLLCCEKTLTSLKQGVEHLQSNCYTRDRLGNTLLHVSSQPMLMELGAFSGHDGRRTGEEIPELQEKTVVPEGLKYPSEFDTLLEALISCIINIQDSQKVKIEEEVAEERIQHKLEIDIISLVFAQEFHNVVHIGDSSASNFCRADKTVSNNFEDLEAQLESFLELEASKLEIIKSGCSTSIARCEFKLETLMENLACQVNEMRTKIAFVQEAVKQQEWKHMVEQDILITIMWDHVSEMNKKLNFHTVVPDFKNVSERVVELSNDSLHSLGIKDTFLSTEFPEEERFDKNPDSPLLIRYKDKLISILKEGREELRKEKAILEQKLIARTEELYSLKRQFWKEREFWVSRLSPPLIKEFEAQVEDLPKHSSALLCLEEHMNMERIRYDSLVTELRKEWLVEKEGLLQVIVEKEHEIASLGAQIIENDTTNNATAAATANLLACISDLSGQVDNLSNAKMKNDFEFAKREKEWLNEKRSIQGEIDHLLEKLQNYVASECNLLDKIADLENEVKSLRSAMLDQQSLLEKSKEEWEAERGSLLKRVLEGQNMISNLDSLSQKWVTNEKRIKQLESERDQLWADQQQKVVLLASLTEQMEVTNTLLTKERMENEESRKLLELEVAKVKLELQNLQGQNTISPDSKVQFDSEMSSEEQINVKSLQALHDFRQRVLKTVEEKSDRLEAIDEVCQIVKGNFKSFSCKEAQYKQKLATQLYNLQKAETEVDLLADEVESLLVILEEVQMVFDLYSPILQHYPKMAEVAAIVRKEVQLRIDPKYGA